MNTLETLRETTTALADCKLLLDCMTLPNNPKSTRRAAAAQLVPVNAALDRARAVLAEADKPAPTHDLLSLRMIAHRKGYSVVEDDRAGCFNLYDNPNGYRKDAAHAFCVGLREVADLLDTLPDVTSERKEIADNLAAHLFDLGCSLNRARS